MLHLVSPRWYTFHTIQWKKNGTSIYHCVQKIYLVSRSMIMKKALVVFPDYRVHGIDERTKYVLQQCRVLPGELASYYQTGVALDEAAIKKILGPQFAYTTLTGEVLAKDFCTYDNSTTLSTQRLCCCWQWTIPEHQSYKEWKYVHKGPPQHV